LKAERYQRIEPAVEREQRTGAVEPLSAHERWQPPVPGDIPWNRRHKKVREIRPPEIVQSLVC